MNKPDIILVANSPGELSALVKPVAEAISQEHRVTLVLTPCQYTSGKENEYVKTLKGIERLVSAKDYKNWILRNKKPPIDFSSKGIVLYLGGDLAHAMLVAKKLRYPALAYVQDFIGWKGFYQKFLAPDEQSQRKLDPKSKLDNKVKIIGNLMVDSISDIPKWQPQENVITFLPGSRAWQINHMTPIYKKIISELKTQNSELKAQLVSSPFENAIPIEGIKTIKFEEAYNSELVITIPGTNTARLAAMGIPMISIFPLDNPDVIPLEGILHYVCSLPYFGSKIKAYFANLMNKQTQFFALPNIKADNEIVPEIRGVIDPSSVAQLALSLLKNKEKRSKMSEDLKSAMGKPGASSKIMEELNVALQKII